MRFILSKFNSLLFSLFWFLLASRREVIGIPQIEGIFHFIFPAIGALSPAPYFPLFFSPPTAARRVLVKRKS